ncbi:MAG: hypothetical protein EXR76_10640 [Myxococcales bacterium]|nr:hypothetical protein [Myxococcales bacterium]
MQSLRIRSVALTALLVTGLASDAAARAHKVEFGLGGLGFVNGAFMTEPSETDKITQIGQTPDGRPAVAAVPYPGYAGVGGGGGLTFNVMYRGAIGAQLDLLFSHDQGKGEINDMEIELSQTAFHMPFLVRGAIPLKHVRPFIFVGPELVVPGEAKVDTTVRFEFVPPSKRSAGEEIVRYLPLLVAGVPTPVGQAGAYLNLQTGFGFEFLIPSEDDLDIRIPLTFRGSFNFDTDEGVDGRLKFSDGPISDGKYVKSINTEWQYQAFITLGVTFNQHVD